MSPPDWRPAVLVTGGRDHIPDRAAEQWFKYWLRWAQPAFVLHGGARGLDLWAEAIARGQGIDVQPLPISDDEWDAQGGAAGPIRNSKLLEVILEHGGGYCVVFDGNTGTADMRGKAQRAGLSMVDMQTVHYREPPIQRSLL